MARTRSAAQSLTAAFRERTTKKTYWALVKGVPRAKEGKISTWLIKEATEDGDRMRIAKHGEEGADHAVSYYRVIDQAAQNLAWLELEPYTGRTHQLRIHCLHLGHPIIGDPKYFEFDKNWGIPKRHAEPSASSGAAHLGAPSRWRPAVGHRTLAAAHGAELEPAGAGRSHGRGAGRMKLALFDCDGTIVDSAAIIHACMERTFDDFRRHPARA